MSDWVPVLVEVTAYCPCKICCGEQARGRTADMTKTSAVPYNLAGDIYNFKFGDEVYLPLGYGMLDKIRAEDRTFTIDDRGGALNSECKDEGIPRLDLRVRDHWWALQFGRKRVLAFLRRSSF